METRQFTRIAVQTPDPETADYRAEGVQRRGANLQQRGRPRGRPQQLGLGDADERREVHVLMSELNELHAPFVPLESVSENV